VEVSGRCLSKGILIVPPFYSCCIVAGH
jgi:hypothetical protein